MEKKLTPTQQGVLDRMVEGYRYCSRGLSCSCRTLEALWKKGYVEKLKEGPEPRYFVGYKKIWKFSYEKETNTNTIRG